MKTLAALFLAFAAGAAVAATVAITYTPPVDHTDHTWSVLITPTATIGTYAVTTTACAAPSVVGAQPDCHTNGTSYVGDTNLNAFVDGRIAAWRTANGY